MKYINAILFILFFTLAFIFFSCEKGTEPEQLKPGRRDYVWEVDTLKAWNTYLMKLWGSSPTDIWAVGSGSSFDQTIWHYDGKKWATDSISRGFDPWCIHGFTQNDIWIGGNDGKIWHYDGSDWSERLSYSKQLKYHYYNIYFMDIWGENPNDIYAVGFADSSNVGLGDVRFGIMLHYDGDEWSRVNIEFTEGLFIKIRKTRNSYFIYNIKERSNQAPEDTAKYIEYNGKEFSTIHSDIDGFEHWHNITILNHEVIFTIDNGIYTYNNKSFNLIAKNPFGSNYQAIFGRNRKDIIWTMADGLTHYNGINFEYILNFENFQLNDGFIRLKDGLVFDNEVFFVSHGNSNNYIFHGVLK